MLSRLLNDMERAIAVLDALHDGRTQAEAAELLNGWGVTTSQGCAWTGESVAVYRQRNLKGVSGQDFAALREAARVLAGETE